MARSDAPRPFSIQSFCNHHSVNPAGERDSSRRTLPLDKSIVVDSKRQSRHHLINEVKSHLIQTPDWMRNLNGHPK